MNQQTSPFSALLSNLTQAMAKPQNLALVRCPPPGANVPATLPDSSSQAIDLSGPPVLHGRPRTGAVASLPKDKRDMVCRMIANGVHYRRIVAALAQLGVTVTERNISNWVTHGGYAEWCVLYQDALQHSLRRDDLLEYHGSDSSPELAEVGLQSAAVRLSELLLRQTDTQSPATDLSKLEPAVTLLCRINKELLAIQKHRDDCRIKGYHNPARIKANAQEKLAETEAQFSAGARPKLLRPAAAKRTSPHKCTSQSASAPQQSAPASRVDSHQSAVDPQQSVLDPHQSPVDPQQSAPAPQHHAAEDREQSAVDPGQSAAVDLHQSAVELDQSAVELDQSAPAPHQSAPAPHQSAPAPHQSAPAPHQSAPAPHQSAVDPHQSEPAQLPSAPAPKHPDSAPIPEQTTADPLQSAPAAQGSEPDLEQVIPLDVLTF